MKLGFSELFNSLSKVKTRKFKEDIKTNKITKNSSHLKISSPINEDVDTRSISSQIEVKETQKQAKTVEERAREIWLEEGCPEGRAEIHWAMAEKELSR